MAMRDFSDLIDAFGTAALAKVLDLPDTHIRTMKTRNSIPPEYWPTIIDAAPKHSIRGITLAVMMKLRGARFPLRERATA